MNLSSGCDFFSPAPPAWPSLTEFQKWLSASPANRQAWSAFLNKGNSQQPPPGGEKTSNQVVSTACNVKRVTAKFKALAEVIRLPAGALNATDRLSRCNALMDEITDDLLDLPEPFRAVFLQRLLPIRERLRTLRA